MTELNLQAHSILGVLSSSCCSSGNLLAWLAEFLRTK